MDDLKGEEQRLLGELDALKQEEEETLKAIDEEELEAQRLGREEDKYWKEYTRHRRDFMQTDDESRRFDLYIFFYMFSQIQFILVLKAS